MKPNYPKQVSLARLPTPIDPMERLSKHLGGPNLYIKRDDQTGLATGGNKTRKLEFLVADAIAQGCDHLITAGGPQSNHCRQTAAAAARFGLGCSLVLTNQKPKRRVGNLLLNELLGAYIYWAEKKERQSKMQEVANELKAMGRIPYIIPVGGSNVIGATGYVQAMGELSEQLQTHRLFIDFIVLASGSGGTQAGMVLGKKVYNHRSNILGISISQPADAIKNQVAALVTATATHLGLGMLPLTEDIDVNDDYLGEGYSIVGEAEREAVQMTAQFEGILLDPVYTGRAMAGLIDLIRWGAFTRGQNILFWHTGGQAALSAFANKLR
ncbi:MAG: D-cysteine desulfhydrase family protein [Chloroflexota bacterium]